MEFKHVSVLLDECIEGLAVKPDGIYVDGTLGGAGHAFHVCERLSEKGQFIGIDQDEAAIRTSTERLQPFGERVHLVRSNYVNVKQVVKELQIDKVDGILWILAYLRINWIRKNADFRIWQMRRWICVWIRAGILRRKIS